LLFTTAIRSLSACGSLRVGCPNTLKHQKFSARLWDLLPSSAQNHVYHPEFGGSILPESRSPALVPEMTYEGMAVTERAGWPE